MYRLWGRASIIRYDDLDSKKLLSKAEGPLCTQLLELSLLGHLLQQVKPQVTSHEISIDTKKIHLFVKARKTKPDLLAQAAFVCSRAQHVQISDEAAISLAHRLAPALATKQLHWFDLAPESVKNYFSQLSQQQKLIYLTVLHSIGFCYWGEPRWTISSDSGPNQNRYDGAMALLVCLASDPNWLELERLANLSFEQFKQMLAHPGGLHVESLGLLEQRWQLLRGLPAHQADLDILFRKDDSLGRAFEISKIQGFADIAEYAGREIPFLKRAQLLVADCNALLNGSNSTTSGVAQAIGEDCNLTAFADYKLPQILRHYGVINYSTALAEIIDNKIEIVSGSTEEVEIRATTILAIERIQRCLQASGLDCNAPAIDNRLWSLAQNLDKNTVKPYHRCRTIFY